MPHRPATTLGKSFQEALCYAVELHAAQQRKMSGAPYVSHLLAVASIALEYGADEEEAVAALLHDAIEDQGGDAVRREIRRRFGDRVAGIVDGCSDSDTQPRPPWQERKSAYIESLAGASSSVLLISASDKLHNARSTLRDLRRRGEEVWGHFKGGRDGTLWYYRSLLDAYRRHGAPEPLVEELDVVVTELERCTRSPGG